MLIFQRTELSLLFFKVTYNQFHLKAMVHPFNNQSDSVAAYEYIANQQATRIQSPKSTFPISCGDRGTGRHSYNLRKLRNKPNYAKI